MKKLIIAAHPDDEILGCGATINKYSSIYDFYVLILTDGSQTRYDKSMEDKLKDYALSANEIIGTKKVFFENLPNQKLDAIPLLTIIQVIESYIEKIKPDTIFTHHMGDLNKDHRIVYEATVTAARPLSESIIKKVYTYFVHSSTEWNNISGEHLFLPNTYIDVSCSIDKKISAMKEYPSECRPYPHPRSPESIKVHANYWGLTVGLEYAEPFILTRSVSGEI